MKRFVFIFSICGACLFWLYSRTIQPNTLTWSLWGYSEWLINYEGGFVRRGLPGQLVRWFGSGQSALHGTGILIFTAGTGVIVLLALLLFLQNRVSLGAALITFIMPGSLIHALAINQFFYRKEIFFPIPIAVAALGLIIFRRRPSKASFWCGTMLSSILGASVVLVHETFILAGLPALCLIWRSGFRAIDLPPAQIRKLQAILMLPIFLAFGASALRPGDQRIADEIWNSLAPQDQALVTSKTYHPRDPFVSERPRKAVSVLASNAEAEVVWVTVSYLESGLGLWFLIFSSILICLAAWMRIADTERSRLSHPARQAHWIQALILLVCSLPIFVFSEDWGRWMACWATITLIVWVSTWRLAEAAPPIPLLSRRLTAPAEKLASIGTDWSLGKTFALLLLWNLFFSIPEYGFNWGVKKNLFRTLLFSVVDEGSVVKYVNDLENVDQY